MPTMYTVVGRVLCLLPTFRAIGAKAKEKGGEKEEEAQQAHEGGSGQGERQRARVSRRGGGDPRYVNVTMLLHQCK